MNRILNKLIKKIQTNKFDYLSNVNPPTFANGLDLEAFKFDKLKEAVKKAKSQFDKENLKIVFRDWNYLWNEISKDLESGNNNLGNWKDIIDNFTLTI